MCHFQRRSNFGRPVARLQFRYAISNQSAALFAVATVAAVGCAWLAHEARVVQLGAHHSLRSNGSLYSACHGWPNNQGIQRTVDNLALRQCLPKFINTGGRDRVSDKFQKFELL